MEEIVNRVAQSGILTIDMEEWFDNSPRTSFDIKDYLFMEMILKEKDFRAALKTLDWEEYREAVVAVHCSADAIVPTWAYMLIGTYLSKVTDKFYFCTPQELDTLLYQDYINKLSVEEYEGKKVVVKGCSDKPVPTSAYVALTKKLMPVVQSLMFGEACSSVPLYKKPIK